MRLATKIGAPLINTTRASIPCFAKSPCSCAMSKGIVRGLIAATPMVILVWASVGAPLGATIREAAIQTISQNLRTIFLLLRLSIRCECGKHPVLRRDTTRLLLIRETVSRRQIIPWGLGLIDRSL